MLLIHPQMRTRELGCCDLPGCSHPERLMAPHVGKPHSRFENRCHLYKVTTFCLSAW